MMAKRTVLVTGVAGQWGGRVAKRLLAEPGWRVIGVDRRASEPLPAGIDFVQADIRHPLLAQLLRLEGVDTVCHLQFKESAAPSAALFDRNVMGTVKLFAACAEAGVGQIVWRSSTAVYGARPGNGLFLDESTPIDADGRYAYVSHWAEMERFAANFRQHAPGLRLATLRFASIIGPTVDTPLTRFLQIPLAPVLLGFDPLMQLIHEKDLIEAVARAVVCQADGAFNIAAEGVLPLSKLMALAGTIAAPVLHPVAYWSSQWLPDRRVEQLMPIEPDYLRYPWLADLSRMRGQLDFVPRYEAGEAAREFKLYVGGRS